MDTVIDLDFRVTFRKFQQLRVTGRILVLASLALLVGHSLFYLFQTDDAFISYRYARNLAHGYGLVFNPGGERVEGYSNLLWVLLLAAGNSLGIDPPQLSLGLSLLLTIALWYVVTALVLSLARPEWPSWMVGWGPLALSVTRSVAVWSTGGLETRCFEFLMLLAMIMAIAVARDDHADRRRFALLPGYALGLCVLLRPEALLLGALALAIVTPAMLSSTRGHRRLLGVWLVSFVAVVLSQLLFRRVYYHEWLPNTYYAKAAGRTWFSLGWRYVFAFVLEYGAYLWLVPVLAAMGPLRRVRLGILGSMLLTIAAAQIAFAASVGGDHFEYRLIDLSLICVLPLVHLGCCALTASPRARWLGIAMSAAVFAGLVAIPWATHAAAPRTYVAGFAAQDPGRLRSVLRSTIPFSTIAPIAQLLDAYADDLIELNGRFADIRQEEHALFFRSVEEQGRQLQRLVAEGRMPSDAYVALDCVGVIPYLSGLRVLDRLGLTDSTVAHGPRDAWRMLAHDKRASFEYARSRGVELWALHRVNLAWDVSEAYPVDAIVRGTTFWYALVDSGHALVCLLPNGTPRPERFPGLTFVATTDPGAIQRYMTVAIQALRVRAERQRDDTSLEIRLAYWFLLVGDDHGAERSLAAVAGSETRNPEWWRVRSLLYLADGDTLSAARGLQTAAGWARTSGQGELAARLTGESAALGSHPR